MTDDLKPAQAGDAEAEEAKSSTHPHAKLLAEARAYNPASGMFGPPGSRTYHLCDLIDRLAAVLEATPQAAEGEEAQLIAQARELHAKAMNCSDLADEGQWRATEDVIAPPLHNYWRVTAVRSPTREGVEPYTVTKALAFDPNVAGLLTFVSTALPKLCALAGRRSIPDSSAEIERLRAVEAAYHRAVTVYSQMEPCEQRTAFGKALNLGPPKASRPQVDVEEWLAAQALRGEGREG